MARSKKEIDKELMYKKLMPTAQASDEGASEPSLPGRALPLSAPPPVPKAEPVQPASEPAPTISAPSAPVPNLTPVTDPSFTPAGHADETPPAPVPSAATAIVNASAPQPPDEIVNVMELLVQARIDAAMEKFRCCTCDKCRKDVTAVTLNKLAPCYILNSDNAKRIEIETKYAGQVATALVQAILTVKARPSHE